MNYVFAFVGLFAALTQASAWYLSWLPWQNPTVDRSDTPEWSKLSVTYLKFSGLPINVNDAIADGWTKDKSCDARSYFKGNRYVLKGDTAVMLLFDSNGKIAGIQNGIPKSAVGNLKLPWISERDLNVITAYFTDPENICSGSRPPSNYLGDQLLLQTGNESSNTMAIPFKQEDLAGTKWVEGGCFPAMGRHYWYNISADMDCSDFYPMFLLYSKKKRLTGFGWVTVGYAESPRYEHPPPKRLGHRLGDLGFFQEETMPKCIPHLEVLTTQHVYLDKRPYLNLCFI